MNFAKYLKESCSDIFNLFMPRYISLTKVVWIHDIFENNSRIKMNFTKYLKESCGFGSDLHFSFRYFQKNVPVTKILPKWSFYLYTTVVKEILKGPISSISFYDDYSCLHIVIQSSYGPFCFNPLLVILN